MQRLEQRNVTWFSRNYRRLMDVDFFDEEIVEAFNVYFFLQKINDHLEIFSQKIKDLHGVEKIAFQFYQDNTKSIEIVFKGILQKVYFIKHAACLFLDKKTKRRFMEKVDRESKSQKLIDFIGSFPKFIDEMEFNISIQRQNRLTIFLN